MRKLWRNGLRCVIHRIRTQGQPRFIICACKPVRANIPIATYQVPRPLMFGSRDEYILPHMGKVAILVM